MRIPFPTMQKEFQRVLVKVGFSAERAELCARIFAENSLDGVASHGLGMFPLFVCDIQEGRVDLRAEPEKAAALGAWEQWDGNSGPGPINATICTERAMQLARENGMGCVALRRTNHWMRGGTYGWQAANAGFIFIGWTNTLPLMPPWGGSESRLGNNPLVLALPRHGGPVVLDFAMSQFSMGRLGTFKRRNEMLPVPGGYDAEGNLTQDPSAIERALPAGCWKGAGLALVLDLTAAVLSDGLTTVQIGRQGHNYDVSQVFIAFDMAKAGEPGHIAQLVEETLEDLHATPPVSGEAGIRYPGERALETRKENLEKGIPVDETLWKQVLEM
jgi:3-dehydro-L-gulonate 2-dehydrogenase